MKTKYCKLYIFLALIICFTFSSFAQNKMNEQRAIKETHIDFTKEYIYFSLHGLIEIDGHTFKNDTCKCPIQFKANLDGIEIIDTCNNVFYEHRECNVKNCKIIHLTEKDVIKSGDYFNNYPLLKWSY